MALGIYDQGDLVRIDCDFATTAGTAADPTTVTLMVRDPNGVETTYTYALGTVTKDGTGSYYKNVTTNTAGLWYYRWISTGTAQGAEERAFHVRNSEIV